MFIFVFVFVFVGVCMCVWVCSSVLCIDMSLGVVGVLWSMLE